MKSATDQRLARVMNGAIILLASLLTFLDERFGWVVLFMGMSLIFSGSFDYCGFEKIFRGFRLWRNSAK